MGAVPRLHRLLSGRHGLLWDRISLLAPVYVPHLSPIASNIATGSKRAEGEQGDRRRS